VRQHLGDKLPQSVQDFPWNRSTPLSEGRRALGARPAFRFHTRSRGPLEQRLRYAPQPKVALERFRLASLSRLQTGHWLAARMQDV
jgi:hypothetical protein